LIFDEHRKSKVHDALWPEALKYTYRDRHSHGEVSPAAALESAIEHVWKNPEKHGGPGSKPKAVYVIESIAEWLARNYDVVSHDAREGDRRAKSADTAG
jgi:hypothetical protein